MPHVSNRKSWLWNGSKARYKASPGVGVKLEAGWIKSDRNVIPRYRRLKARKSKTAEDPGSSGVNVDHVIDVSPERISLVPARSGLQPTASSPLYRLPVRILKHRWCSGRCREGIGVIVAAIARRGYVFQKSGDEICSREGGAPTIPIRVNRANLFWTHISIGWLQTSHR